MTVENFDKNKGNCPTGSHKWEYVHNGEWTETNDVFVECSMPSTTSDTTNTVSEFLYYKNNVWAHEKIRQPHDSPLIELLYYKNNVWSKTDFLKDASSKNSTTPPKMKHNTAGENGQFEVKSTASFNTLSFFEGIICIILSYIIGYVVYKFYIFKATKGPIKCKQFSNQLSAHNSIEGIEVTPTDNVQTISNGNVSIMM